jgi:hypothetical protein
LQRFIIRLVFVAVSYSSFVVSIGVIIVIRDFLANIVITTAFSLAVLLY